MHKMTALAFLVASLVTPCSGAFSQDFGDMLEARDKLNIKILEWLPAKGEYKEWTAVGGEYSISGDGRLRIPFVGEIDTTGQSLDTLTRRIADGLQSGLSLHTRPEVSLEVLTRSPVYIIGGVETPGRIEFTPGLTALKAVASAGGFYRGAGGTMRLERDVILAEGDLVKAREAASRLKAQIARLGAEAEASDDVSAKVPERDRNNVAPFLAEEQQLLDVRREARLSQIEGLRSRKKLAEGQIKAIDEKTANLTRQAKLTSTQLTDIQSLVGKGLSVASRALELERLVADIEGRVLDLNIARLTASLEINQAERDEADLTTTFKTAVANDLQKANASLASTLQDIQRSDALVREATLIAPERLMDRAGNLEIGIRLFRTRLSGGQASTVEIGKDDLLKAGDTLQVQLDLGRSTEASVR